MVRAGFWWVTLAAAIPPVGCSDTNVPYESMRPPPALCGGPSNGGSCLFAEGTTCLEDDVVTCFHGSDGDCYQLKERCAPGTCVSTLAGPHCADCEEIRRLYGQAFGGTTAEVVLSGSEGLAPGEYNRSYGCQPDDCSTTTSGYCEIGLGLCWYLGKPIPRAEELANSYRMLGCSVATTCDCPAPTSNAVCKPKPGGKDPLSQAPFSHACVVE